jgi:hypothetical protein
MISAGGILSLDLSLSSTGFAYGCYGERPVFWAKPVGKLAAPGEAYAVLEDYCDAAIRAHKPRAVTYEAPLPTHRKINKEGDGARSTNEIAITLIRLGGIVELISTRHRLPYYHQDVTEARRRVLGAVPRGKSEAVKPVIMAWARGRGWDVQHDDEADALVILAYSTVILDRTRKAHFHRHGEIL